METETFNQEYLEKIAKVCHQANKAYCESIGDISQLDWENAFGWQKQSAISGVAFKINNPNADDDSQHNAWMEDKINNGWVYGKIKDQVLKTHPCIVPYKDLPLKERIKDTLFIAIVNALK